MQGHTQYHHVLLYQQRLVMVSRISELVVQELPLADRAGLAGQPVGLAVDDVTPTLYLYTSTPHSLHRPCAAAGKRHRLLGHRDGCVMLSGMQVCLRSCPDVPTEQQAGLRCCSRGAVRGGCAG